MGIVTPRCDQAQSPIMQLADICPQLDALCKKHDSALSCEVGPVSRNSPKVIVTLRCSEGERRKEFPPDALIKEIEAFDFVE